MRLEVAEIKNFDLLEEKRKKIDQERNALFGKIERESERQPTPPILIKPCFAMLP